MKIEQKILEELRRFNEISKYVLIEQDPGAAPPPPPGGEPTPPAGGAPPPPPPPAGGPEATEGANEEPLNVDEDPDVEVVDEPGTDTATDTGEEETKPEGEEETEEIDITDLVNTQQEIKDKQQEIMDNLFGKLDDLQTKLANMDQIFDKISNLEAKFDRYREKTPEEKLELRSLDSYPYNQKLTDFFDDKKVDMEKSGKNEYILTSDEVENFSPNEIKKTSNKYEQDEEEM